MLESYFIRGMLIGLVFGVPAGAIGALTIQRTLSHGFSAGFITGLGSSVADLIYACIGVFGVTLVSNFLLAHQTSITVAGCGFIMILGILIFRKKPEMVTTCLNSTQLSGFFVTSFAIALTNPATIMAFFMAFSAFGITQKLELIQGAMLILGVLVGTCCWWGFLSGGVSIFRNRITAHIYKQLNHLLGSLLLLFGVVMLARTFYI